MFYKPQQKQSRIQSEKGFSLIEALVAIAIFSIGFMAVGAMQINSMSKTNSARQATEANTVAVQQAEMLRALPFYDKSQDLDGAGGVEPFDMLPVFDPADNPHVINVDGPYTVHWTVDLTQPLPGYPAGVLDLASIVPNSMMIRLWVTRDIDDTDILADFEFAKFCGEIE